MRVVYAAFLCFSAPHVFGADLRLETTLTQLTHTNACVRQSAVLSLGALLDARALPALLNIMSHQDPEMRKRAALALGRIKEPGGFAALTLALCQDSQAAVRRAAAFGLALLGDTLAAPSLIYALHDASPLVRGGAAWAIGALQEASVLPTLIRMMSDKEIAVRHHLLIALGMQEGSPEVVSALIHALKDPATRGPAASVLAAQNDPQSVPLLTQLLNTGIDPSTRQQAGLLLLRLPQGLSALTLALVTDADEKVRLVAAFSIGAYKPMMAANEATRQDPAQWDIQPWPVRMLQGFKCDPGLPLEMLTPALPSFVTDRRPHPVENLAKNDAAALPALMQALRRDSSPDVRAEIAWAIGQLDHEAVPAIPVLKEAIKDLSPKVRKNAQRALDALGAITNDSFKPRSP